MSKDMSKDRVRKTMIRITAKDTIVTGIDLRMKWQRPLNAIGKSNL
jgi:hypothetical protein